MRLARPRDLLVKPVEIAEADLGDLHRGEARQDVKLEQAAIGIA